MPSYNHQEFYRDMVTIDLDAEKDYLVFRYSDLTQEAREKFARAIKRDSSIWTVRSRAELKDIKSVLRCVNPILIRPGYNGSFSGSSIFRWREKIISRIIYYSLFRREPRRNIEWNVKYMCETPSGALENSEMSFNCSHCGNDLPIRFRDSDGMCQECSREEDRRYNYNANYKPAADPDLPSMWCGNRPSLVRSLSYQLGLGIGKLRSKWRQLGIRRRFGYRRFRDWGS